MELFAFKLSLSHLERRSVRRQCHSLADTSRQRLFRALSIKDVFAHLSSGPFMFFFKLLISYSLHFQIDQIDSMLPFECSAIDDVKVL